MLNLTKALAHSAIEIFRCLESLLSTNFVVFVFSTGLDLIQVADPKENACSTPALVGQNTQMENLCSTRVFQALLDPIPPSKVFAAPQEDRLSDLGCLLIGQGFPVAVLELLKTNS